MTSSGGCLNDPPCAKRTAMKTAAIPKRLKLISCSVSGRAFRRRTSQVTALKAERPLTRL